jgi:integrase
MRSRYQFGTVELVERKKGDYYRFRYTENSVRKSVILGTAEKLKTQRGAEKAAESYRVKANPDHVGTRQINWGTLLDRYIEDELPPSHSAAKAYRSNINTWVRPKWGEYPIEAVKTFAVEQWLKAITELSPKSKNHIKTCMSCAYNSAIRWELVDPRLPNPLKLVRVPGCSKRKSEPLVLTVEQVWKLIEAVDQEPFKTMLLVGVCYGLRSCEVVGLKWSDFDFQGMTVHIQRGVVEGREGKVKTVHSQKRLPVADVLAEKLLCWRSKSIWKDESDWVFASPYYNGSTPYWPKSAMNYHIMPKAKEAGVQIKGWHTFRHTYSTLLRALGIDIKVQQALLRHADIRTTLDGYTQAIEERVRAANSLLVNRLVN